ncbi:MAG: hypothetical protein AAFS10_03305 [Myxococcota bacterium]
MKSTASLPITVCMLALVLTWMGTSTALSKPTRHTHATYTGTFSFEDTRLQTTWTAWFDISPEQARVRLAQWPKSDSLFPSATNFKLLRSSADGAAFYIERSAPVFMSNPNMTVRAVLQHTEDADRTTLTWTRTGGTIAKFNKVWVLTPESGGTRVEQRMDVQLPVAPPNFAKPDPKDALAQDVELFRKRIGAKRAKAR